ncbi:MAG: RnfABCDGE type electron transport complex subunit D [Elusimicrobiota bacterium]
MVEKSNLLVASSPHIHSGDTVRKVMANVMIALLPATAASVYYFGLPAAIVIAVSVFSCVLAEYVWKKAFKLTVNIDNLSAAVTGLLLGLTLPPGLPWWMVVIGSVFAVAAGRHSFGALSRNILNPALAGRAFLQIVWPGAMITWTKPFETVTAATPLTISKHSLPEALPTYFDMLIGNRTGSLGETCIIALLAGAVFLLIRKDIFLTVPIAFIGTVAAGAALFGEDPIFHVLGGGLVLGAFFMATDPITSPVPRAGKIIFGVGCGTLTILMRVKGWYSEGVCFSILAMNLIVPLLDKSIIPGRFGGQKGAADA